MRRFISILVLAALLAVSVPTVTVAIEADAAEARTASAWQALVDLLRPIFGASEGDGSPEWDPNGIQVPPSSGSDGGTSVSRTTDGTPEANPNG